MTASFESGRDIIIRTPSWEDAVRFYQSVLELPVVHRDKTLVGFDTGAFTLYVEQGAAHGPVLEFLVPDVARAKARLLAAGCVVLEENPSVPRCYLRDPQGLAFNLRRSHGDGGRQS
jgi:catechol 2,3-dioxygenase-like lactoylglutathione lyase family enzyme